MPAWDAAFRILVPVLALLVTAIPNTGACGNPAATTGVSDAEAPAVSHSKGVNEQKLLGERTFEFTYRISVSDFPADASSLSIWIPIPRETELQQVKALAVECDVPYEITREPVYGNRILYLEASDVLPEKVGVDVTYTIRRQGYKALQGMALGNLEIRPADLQRFLKPSEMIPIDGVIATRARRALENAGEGTIEKARALYNDVLRTMTYDKSGTGWGRGDALFACDAGRGNCTDFHSLFIGMARASGIPARFVMGFPLPSEKSEGDIPGYHCWAEFYDEESGWIPLDASEAWKHPEQRDFLFGGLDPNRVEFTLGRDVPLAPPGEISKRTTVNFFIYPHVLVDGRLHEGVVKGFGFRDVKG